MILNLFFFFFKLGWRILPGKASTGRYIYTSQVNHSAHGCWADNWNVLHCYCRGLRWKPSRTPQCRSMMMKSQRYLPSLISDDDELAVLVLWNWNRFGQDLCIFVQDMDCLIRSRNKGQTKQWIKVLFTLTEKNWTADFIMFSFA